MASLAQGPPSSTPGDEPPDDSALVVLVLQAQARDEIAFTTLYKRYFPGICVYLTRMVGNEGVGSELAQETLLKVWRALPGLHTPSAFVAWLYRIATNLAHDYQRRTKRLDLDYYGEELGGSEKLWMAGPEEQVEASEMLKIALARVSWKYRACLILYHLEGRSKHEIAEFLGIKEKSVSAYVSLGLEEFRQIYARFSTERTPSREEERDR